MFDHLTDNPAVRIYVVVLSSASEKDFWLALTVRVPPVCHPSTNSPLFPSHREKANCITPQPQCRPTRALAAHGPMPLCARNACPPSRLPKRHRRPSAHLATGDNNRAWFCVQAHVRHAVRCQRALATSDPVFSIMEVDVGHVADLSTPAQMTILAGDASLLHRLALSERRRRCGHLVFCCTSCLVRGRGSRALQSLSLRRPLCGCPIIIMATKSCMRLMIRAACLFVQSLDELIFWCRGF